MTAESAPIAGMEIVVVEREAGSPAGLVVGSANEIVGDWRDETIRAHLIERVDLVTLENEFVDADALRWFGQRGVPVVPNPDAVALIQDKLRQKESLSAAGIPVALFRSISSDEDIRSAGRDLGWPLILKARRNGYDGYGNATLRGPDDIAAAMARLSDGTGAGAAGGLYVEQWIPFVAEVAAMVAIGTHGEIAPFPVTRTTQRDHICHEAVVPAGLDSATTGRAESIAVAAARASGAQGVIGVEMFQMAGGAIVVNELAPRPHNSGHYSIEGCRASQFLNHLLAIAGRPLGSTALTRPGVAMVNLLGTTRGRAAPRGVKAAVALPETFVHIYGKREVRLGRKMGHVTALGDSAEEALDRARRAAGMIEW